MTPRRSFGQHGHRQHRDEVVPAVKQGSGAADREIRSTASLTRASGWVRRAVCRTPLACSRAMFTSAQRVWTLAGGSRHRSLGRDAVVRGKRIDGHDGAALAIEERAVPVANLPIKKAHKS